MWNTKMFPLSIHIFFGTSCIYINSTDVKLMFSGGYAIFFNERNNLVFLGVNIFKIDERGKTTLLGYYIFDRIKKKAASWRLCVAEHIFAINFHGFLRIFRNVYDVQKKTKAARDQSRVKQICPTERRTRTLNLITNGNISIFSNGARDFLKFSEDSTEHVHVRQLIARGT